MGQESLTDWQDLNAATLPTAGGQEPSGFAVPGLTILAHPDVSRIGERALLTGFAAWSDVYLSRVEPRFSAHRQAPGRSLEDLQLSRRGVRLVPAVKGAVRLVLSGSPISVVADGQPVSEARQFSAAALRRGVVLLLAGRIALLLHTLAPPPADDVPSFGLVGQSAAMQAVRRQIAGGTLLGVPMLLRGEPGTGKKRVAKCLHRAWNRRRGSFVALRASALAAAREVEELFGPHGSLVRAQGGTFFLDHIEEMSKEAQTLLLSVLESAAIPPLGSEPRRPVDVRVLAGTCANLEAEVEAGRFKAPLLYRLNGCEIRLPALRLRRDDIAPLFVHFLKREVEPRGGTWPAHGSGDAEQPWLSAPLVARLATYPWPGNVSQLRDVARQLVIHNRGAAQLRITPQVEELLATPISAASAAKAPLFDEPGDRPAVKTLVYTDLVESTKLIARLGDHRALEVMTRHDRASRRLLAEYGGLEIDKSDGFLMLFDQPADAVAFALALHQALAVLSTEMEAALETRVSIHFGTVLLRRNRPKEVAHGAKPIEVEGLAKAVAARLLSLARAGQTLLTRQAFDVARKAAEQADSPISALNVRWHSHGEKCFQGLQEPVEVFEASLERTRAAEGTRARA